MADPLKMEVVSPRFWMTPLRKVEVETIAETGRTYFLFGGKIIAVAKRVQTQEEADGRIAWPC